MRTKFVLAISMIASLSVPAHGTTDVDVAITRGVCTVFDLAGKPARCTSMTSAHTVHSGRTNFIISGAKLSLGFVGGEDIELGTDTYMLLVDTLIVKNRPHQAKGQCMARLSRRGGQVLAVTCSATYVGGKARVVFKSTSTSLAGQL